MNNLCRRVWPYALTVLMAGAILVMAPGSSWAKHKDGTTPDATKPENVRDTIHNLGTSPHVPWSIAACAPSLA